MWAASWTQDGQRRRRFFSAKRDAVEFEALMRRREQDIADGLIDRRTAEVQDRQQEPIAYAVDAYVGMLERRGRSRQHTREQRRLLELITTGMVAVGQINHDRIMARIATLSAGKSPRTYNGYIKAARAWCRWLDGHAWIHRNPLATSELRRDDADTLVRRVWAPVEVQQLLAIDKPRHVARYAFMVFTGLRPLECERITWAMIDWPERVLTLPGKVTKTGKPAVLPLCELAIEQLTPGVGSHRVFAGRIDDRTWARHRSLAGVQHLTDDGIACRAGLRKTFATWLAQAGVDTDTRARLMRHAGGITESTYTDRSKLLPAMRAAVDRLAAWYLDQINPEMRGQQHG